jgi:hypothetical protein
MLVGRALSQEKSKFKGQELRANLNWKKNLLLLRPLMGLRLGNSWTICLYSIQRPGELEDGVVPQEMALMNTLPI